MNIINKRLTIKEFKDYIAKKSFSPNNPNKIVLHHTWRPDVQDWNGAKTIGGLKRYYEGLGWAAGPHLFIAEDGIWLFSDMNKVGIHAGTGNTRSIGIEVVGNYDIKRWEGKTKENAIGAIKLLMDKLGLDFADIFFHSQYISKTCPGKMITKDWLKKALKPVEKEVAKEPIIESKVVIPEKILEPVATQNIEPEKITVETIQEAINKLNENPTKPAGVIYNPSEEPKIEYTWLDELKELIRDLINLFKKL